MKNLLIILLIPFLSFTVTYGEYCEGWEDGYKEGWCYNKGLGCFEPMVIPVCPTPRIEESPNSYKDGYNRGFVTAQRKNQ